MRTLKAALLGRELSYSISPKVHSALFDILKTRVPSDYDSIDYTTIECEHEGIFLQQLFTRLGEGFDGFNVTNPYKHAARHLPGERSLVVRRIDSANTVACTTPRKVISTDGPGFLFALNKSFPMSIPSTFALVILGAGGAARAVLNVLNDFPWRLKIIAARSIEEAIRAGMPYAGVKSLILDNFMRDSGPHFIVHATPVGQRNSQALLENFVWQSGDIAADLVYNPLRTRFLDNAELGGARILDGLGMLIEQAALAQYFWMSGNESKESVLSQEEFYTLHASLSQLLTPRWDAFAF